MMWGILGGESLPGCSLTGDGGDYKYPERSKISIISYIKAASSSKLLRQGLVT